MDDIVNSSHPVHTRRYVLSGLTREAFERGDHITITAENVKHLLESASIPDGPLGAMDRILTFVSLKGRTPAEFVGVLEHDYPIAFAKDGEELEYYIDSLVKLGFLEPQGKGLQRLLPVRLTPSGWQRVIEIRKTEQDSNQAFIAMWFNDELGSTYDEGFKPALTEVGYHPVRIDLEQFNDKICDRIVAEIRRSGLLVADMTGNRGGVYFEAGFAMGLGIPVIWTCRQDYIEKVHFDTRQYNHIVWTDAEDLKEKLTYRIEATIPGRVRRTQGS